LTSPTSDVPILFSTLSNMINSLIPQTIPAAIHLVTSDRNDAVTDSSQNQMPISFAKMTLPASSNSSSITAVDQILTPRTATSRTSLISSGKEGPTPLQCASATCLMAHALRVDYGQMEGVVASGVLRG
jgi:hypothetical protein